jgi:hypothetical protein
MMKDYKNVRACRGIASLELAVGSFLMIALSALGMNLCLINFATSANDSVCRDAARAAAQTNSATAALQAVNAQLSMHATDGFFLSQPTLPSTSAPDFDYNDYAGNEPINTSAYVTVTTQMTVKVPAPILFLGAHFCSGNTLLVKRRYTFPIIKEKFYP